MGFPINFHVRHFQVHDLSAVCEKRYLEHQARPTHEPQRCAPGNRNIPIRSCLRRGQELPVQMIPGNLGNPNQTFHSMVLRFTLLRMTHPVKMVTR